MSVDDLIESLKCCVRAYLGEDTTGCSTPVGCIDGYFQKVVEGIVWMRARLEFKDGRRPRQPLLELNRDDGKEPIVMGVNNHTFVSVEKQQAAQLQTALVEAQRRLPGIFGDHLKVSLVDLKEAAKLQAPQYDGFGLAACRHYSAPLRRRA